MKEVRGAEEQPLPHAEPANPRVKFKRDPMTPYETQVMQKAGWHREEHSDGSVSWSLPAPISPP